MPTMRQGLLLQYQYLTLHKNFFVGMGYKFPEKHNIILSKSFPEEEGGGKVSFILMALVLKMVC